MPHRKERPSGSSLHAQGSAGTEVRARGWAGQRQWLPLYPLYEHLLTAVLAALPRSRGIQEMAVDLLYDYVFFEAKMLLI